MDRNVRKFLENVFNALVLIASSRLVLHMDNIPTYVAVIFASAVSLVVAILVQIFVVPWQKKKILGGSKNGEPVKFTFGDSDGKYSRVWS